MLDTQQSAETSTQAIDPRGNLVPHLKEDALEKFRAQCKVGIDADRKAMSDWLGGVKDARELSKMNASREAHFDLAADVQTPALAVASMQFAARAYPTLMADDRPVKAKVHGQDEVGEKAAAAERVGAFMSYFLTEEADYWEDDLDLMLHAMPVDGVGVKKVYFCPSRQQPVSEVVAVDNLILNPKAKSRKGLRIAQEIELYNWEIEERVRRGLWVPLKYEEGEDDTAKPQMFYEIYCRLDIDGDGYEEPYILMMHKESEQVVRIQRNFEDLDVEQGPEGIVKVDEAVTFIFFPFLPDPEYPVLGMGYGKLMLKIGASINSILNQLIDAGTLANVGGGIIDRNLRLNGKSQSDVAIDEWSYGDLSQTDTPFVEFPRPQPSTVLFSLLGYLVDMTKEISSTTDAMTGEMSQNVQPTTLIALIEQGQKVYNSIYKRIYRCQKKEYKALFRVIGQNMRDDVYIAFHDQQVSTADFNLEGMDISPQADPNMASDVTEMARVGVLQQLLNDPMINRSKAMQRILNAAKLEPEFFVEPPQQQGPSPEMALELEKLQMESDKLAVAERKQDLEEEKAHSAMNADRYANLLKHAQAIAALAQAEATEEGIQMAEYQQGVSEIQYDEQMRQKQVKDDYDRRISAIQAQRAFQAPAGPQTEGSTGGGGDASGGQDIPQ